jgi:hypothetical protein
MQRTLLCAIAVIATIGSASAEPIVTESTNTIVTPPPTAVSPTINTTNTDLCVVAESGAVQTQILGVSTGAVTTDLNCERLKISKTLYDMGMKVAAVSVMCQDARVFDAMNKAGTPCPIDGKIGEEAKAEWDNNPSMKPESIKSEMKHGKVNSGLLMGLGAIALLGIAAH